MQRLSAVKCSDDGCIIDGNGNVLEHGSCIAFWRSCGPNAGTQMQALEQVQKHRPKCMQAHTCLMGSAATACAPPLTLTWMTQIQRCLLAAHAHMQIHTLPCLLTCKHIPLPAHLQVCVLAHAPAYFFIGPLTVASSQQGAGHNSSNTLTHANAHICIQSLADA